MRNRLLTGACNLSSALGAAIGAHYLGLTSHMFAHFAVIAAVVPLYVIGCADLYFWSKE